MSVGPSLAYGRRIRSLLDAAHGASLSLQIEVERQAFPDLTATADFTEDTGAFLEKRTPRFRGR